VKRQDFILPLLLGATVSCGSPTEPSLLPTNLQITNVTFTGPPAPPLSVATAPDTVRIAGGIQMNEPCYDFEARAVTRGDTLVVDLLATRRTTACQQYIASFSFVLTVTGVDSGLTAVRLDYVRRGPPTYRQTVLEQAVQIP